MAGAADLSIALDSLDGDLDFTDLECWSAGQAPGAAGSGTTWSDGDLSYDVEVRGSTFTRTAGDAGIVTGAFLGTRHQAMGGHAVARRSLRRIRRQPLVGLQCRKAGHRLREA